MKYFLRHIFFFYCISVFSQQEFHVAPNGTPTGNGTRQAPWDLQTALSQKPETVNGGDTIWLRGGTYNGRFLSTIKSTIADSYITVMPYKGEKVTLNGNAPSEHEAVLNVRGGQVIFRDFEITWLGEFSRDENDENFRVSGGISHTSGQDCRFYNLVIHDVPGLGIGSWKATGGTIIENCFIYHNGYTAKNGDGRGEGMYVQNRSDKTRLIKNNIIFGNYYKAVEIWSAGKHAKEQFVKNIRLEGNIIFNSGLPTRRRVDNVIIASDDRNGLNIAHNIQVIGNILYHNTDYLKTELNGDAPSLTLGFYVKSPVENILVKDNIILGRTFPVRFLHVKTMTFTDNIVYGNNLFFNQSEMQFAKNWVMDRNHYYTRSNDKAYRVQKGNYYSLDDWRASYGLDAKSRWSAAETFDLKGVLSIQARAQEPNAFNLALFDKQGDAVAVDFSDYSVSIGSRYTVYDVENRKAVLVSGVLGDDKKVTVPMASTAFERPLHNEKTKKTGSNFGAYVIKFETESANPNKELSTFERFLKWLGL